MTIKLNRQERLTLSMNHPRIKKLQQFIAENIGKEFLERCSHDGCVQQAIDLAGVLEKTPPGPAFNVFLILLNGAYFTVSERFVEEVITKEELR